MFVHLCHIVVPKGKNGQPSTIINHVQFVTKYSNTLIDKPLSKNYRVNVDLDGQKKGKKSMDEAEIKRTTLDPFPVLLSQTRNVCKSWPFSENY